MDEEYAKPRDLDADLVEITSRLGEPEATYRTNLAGVIWRFILGVVIVIAAAGLHYVMWTGVLPWPRGHVKLWFLLIAGMFVVPGVGLYLIGFAVRGLKLWVLVYPTGLFVWHRGQVHAFPWDDLRALQIKGLPQKSPLNLDESAVWYDLKNSGQRVFGTTLTLTRNDGEQVALSSTLNGFAELGRRIQEETFRRLFPPAWEQLCGEATLEFGPFTCNHLGVSNKGQVLPWPEVAEFRRAGDKLEIKRVGKKKPWTKCDFHDVVNPHVLMGIAEAMRSQSQAR